MHPCTWHPPSPASTKNGCVEKKTLHTKIWKKGETIDSFSRVQNSFFLPAPSKDWTILIVFMLVPSKTDSLTGSSSTGSCQCSKCISKYLGYTLLFVYLLLSKPHIFFFTFHFSIMPWPNSFLKVLYVFFMSILFHVSIFHYKSRA